MLGGAAPAETEEPAKQPKSTRERDSHEAPSQAARRPKSSAAYHARRRKARDRDDQALVEAMRDAPDGLIGDWAKAIGKGRSSTVSALKRLRDAGLTKSVEGKWRLTEEQPPREPAPKWVAPVRGLDRAVHPHLT
jgi:hypothetical protein